MNFTNVLNIWLDSEGDLLEVGWSVEKGYFTETDDERVLKRVNLDGEVIGFMVQGVGSMKGSFLDLDLGPEKPTNTVDNLTVKGAADELGVTEARVRQLAAQGRIEGAHKIGRDWIIPRPVEVMPGTRGPAGAATRKAS